MLRKTLIFASEQISSSFFFFLNEQMYHLHFDFSSNVSFKILIYQHPFPWKEKNYDNK